ncbi:hypothetical protein [Bacillus sp. 165]|uniref:hypothetical protein n=1 Tax=Bacillus sp. 165 TaxID=1529117 RepID=UPI001ADC81F5|nr:hypothetical protein [Bacillus sp. 165]MBO9129988.1 hypothetical protein [Bacillus sp. 165]
MKSTTKKFTKLYLSLFLGLVFVCCAIGYWQGGEGTASTEFVKVEKQEAQGETVILPEVK